MPRLNRCYGHGFLHFITFSCYRRLRFLGTGRRRDLFLRLLEQTRRDYGFVVVGYVVMPEHVHLLISEPQRGHPGTVVQVVKQRFARALLRDLRKNSIAGQQPLWRDAAGEDHVWQARFYDFVVYTRNKKFEKLHYMRQNPVKRRLVLEPEQWLWSSYRDYEFERPGPVLVNEALRAEMKMQESSIKDSDAA